MGGIGISTFQSILWFVVGIVAVVLVVIIVTRLMEPRDSLVRFAESDVRGAIASEQLFYAFVQLVLLQLSVSLLPYTFGKLTYRGPESLPGMALLAPVACVIIALMGYANFVRMSNGFVPLTGPQWLFRILLNTCVTALIAGIIAFEWFNRAITVSLYCALPRPYREELKNFVLQDWYPGSLCGLLPG
jgi:hypothetical protein